MALYHVEGTSLTDWSLLVGAGSESEAFESALRFVRYHSELHQEHPSAARTGGV